MWHHVAATYDTHERHLEASTWTGTSTSRARPSWRCAPGSPIALPQNNSIQHAAIGSALNSTGVAVGFFQGIIDEARIWNTVRSQAQIQASMNSEVSSGTGLVGRWHLNEGSGRRPTPRATATSAP